MSFCTRPNRSVGAGVYPVRYTRETPAASAERNIEPTLCVLRMSCNSSATSIRYTIYKIRYTVSMLSLFPQLLFLAPFSATILRVSAGIAFLLIAWIHMSKREELSRVDFFVIGHGAWIPVFAALLEFAIAAALLAGIYTQLAALFGALVALKSFVWKRRLDRKSTRLNSSHMS